MRFLEELSRPRTVLIVLALIVAVNSFLLFYRYQSGSRTPDTAEQSAAPERSEAEYVTDVGNIQNGSVEALADSNDKLLRYDAITGDDVAELQANYLTLRGYSNQANHLDAPEKYGDQHEVFNLGIGELYSAAEIAYRMAAEPVSATYADFKAYERHVDNATTYLRQSNEILGQDYQTTEGLRRPTAI